MSLDEKALATLLAKADIRELVELYARGSDRRDMALLRSLYTKNGVHVHGEFNGSAAAFFDAWEAGLKQSSGRASHYICNHLIFVDGDEAQGEVNSLAWHLHDDGKGGAVEDLVGVRYFDVYRKEGGQWRIAKRRSNIDFKVEHSVAAQAASAAMDDPSYSALSARLFARGARVQK
jgi:ketosteroid isomerase-like protein